MSLGYGTSCGNAVYDHIKETSDHKPKKGEEYNKKSIDDPRQSSLPPID
jgi:hypothetical protein